MHSSTGKVQLHSDCAPANELENVEIIPPVELPAVEPVGSELNTPIDGKEGLDVEARLPLSPLTTLFVMTEIRDQNKGEDESLKHDTFYHP